MIINTDGIVIKRFDFRETSRVVMLFSREFGKIKGVMKGIRKDPRKFASNADLYSYNEFVYYEYRRSDLHLISKCDMRRPFYHIRKDYPATLAAAQLVDLVDKFTPAEEPDSAVFDLLMAALNALDERVDPEKVQLIFQIKLLQVSGFQPWLESCVHCRHPLTKYVWLSYRSGGVVCSQCPAYEPELVALNRGTVASMLFILSKGWQEACRLHITAQARKELLLLLKTFLQYHLDRHIRSLTLKTPACF